MSEKQCVYIEAPLYEGSPASGTEFAFETIVNSSEKKPTTKKYNQRIAKAFRNDFFSTKNISAVITKCENVRINVLETFKNNDFPVVIGGDHSIAMASIAADSELYGIDNLAVIYIDGHCDINTEETSVSHNIHGMPLASSLGLCHETLQVGLFKQKILGDNLFILGARSIDEPEFKIIEDNKVHLYKNIEINKKTLPQIFNELQNSIGSKKVHLSFDVDALDPSVLTSTGYVMPNGLSLNTVKEIIEFAFIKFDVISFDIVEYNPLFDKEKRDLKVVLDILDLVQNCVMLKDTKLI